MKFPLDCAPVSELGLGLQGMSGPCKWGIGVRIFLSTPTRITHPPTAFIPGSTYYLRALLFYLIADTSNSQSRRSRYVHYHLHYATSNVVVGRHFRDRPIILCLASARTRKKAVLYTRHRHRCSGRHWYYYSSSHTAHGLILIYSTGDCCKCR